MMDALGSYNHGHNVLALRNCNISVVHNLFLVLLHLNLIHAPGIWFTPFLHSGQGATFQPEPCRQEFYPSSIHSSCKYAYHVIPTYKSCRIVVAVLVNTSIASDSYPWHVFWLPDR